jgi:hypothetical protein
MQLYGTIYCLLIALHVSSDIIAHHQKLLNCIFTASVDTYVRHCLLTLGENQNSVLILPRHRQAVSTYVSTEAVKIV